MRVIWVVVCFFLFVSVTAADEARPVHLMPWPANVTVSSSAPLLIQPSFAVALKGADPHLSKAAQIFLDDLRRHTGSLPLDFNVTGNANSAQLTITTDQSNEEVQKLGEDESYTLQIGRAHV